MRADKFVDMDIQLQDKEKMEERKEEAPLLPLAPLALIALFSLALLAPPPLIKLLPSFLVSLTISF